MLRQCNEENYATCGDTLTKIIMHNFSSFLKHCDPESENLTHKS